MGEKKPTIAVHILGQEAMIRVNCMRDSYASMHMMMALQELRLEIRHSNTSTTQDMVLHIFIVKVCVVTRNSGCPVFVMIICGFSFVFVDF